MKGIISLIKNPYKIFLYLSNNTSILNFLPDKKIIKLIYRAEFGKKLDLENAQTFNEKLQWLKLYDRNNEYTKMVDKYEVKKIVADKIGEEYIIPTLGVWDKFDDIDFEELPNQFVLKCTHDSGGIVICKNKKEFSIKDARKKINKALKRKYYYIWREWPYKNVKPRIIAEKYMQSSQNDLEDYKMMSFNGKIKVIYVCNNRFSDKGVNITFFDEEWNKLPFQRSTHPSSDKKIAKPSSYDEMIKLGEILSKDIPFVRVDFYEIDNKPYFGEMTFYPTGGFEKFDPEEWDFRLGNFIELPKRRK